MNMHALVCGTMTSASAPASRLMETQLIMCRAPCTIALRNTHDTRSYETDMYRMALLSRSQSGYASLPPHPVAHHAGCGRYPRGLEGDKTDLSSDSGMAGFNPL
jgi:hypothetical protein